MFRFAATSMPVNLTRLGVVALACATLTLSGCGGGSRAKDYQPDSVVSFGDENSLLESYASTTLDPAGSASKTIQGLVYTVNAVATGSVNYCSDTTANTLCSNPITTTVSNYAPGTLHGYYFDSVNNHTTVDNVVTFIDVGTGDYAAGTGQTLKRTVDRIYSCASSVLWNQVIAHSFNKGFGSVCALDVDGASTYATYGAKVADLQAQISANRGRLGEGVLVTIMIGQNDILEVYNRVQHASPTPIGGDDPMQIMAARGATVAAIVKDVLSTGAKVVLALTPDLGQSPLAGKTGESQTLLSQYTREFNRNVKTALGSDTAQDGRHLALVDTDLFTNPITRSSAYNYNTAVCLSSGLIRPDGSAVQSTDADVVAGANLVSKQVKYCNASTLVTNGSTSTYIWADDVHYAPAGHGLAGSLGASRAFNQF